MGKRVVFAVAGAGKTTAIVDGLEETSRALIVTYTNNNLFNLKKKIKAKFGYMPEGIKVMSYFSFLYCFCYRPFLLDKMKTTGIFYEPNPNTFARRNDDAYFISPSRRLYSNRIALLVQDKDLCERICQRISKYYDKFIIDEVQDLSGHDFNVLLELIKTEADVFLVGDFYQYTYATSRDGNVRRNLHSDYDTYKQLFSQAGLTVDESSLIKSYRCSPTTCEFVKDKLGINIESHNASTTNLRELADNDIADIMANDDIIKLFYRQSNLYAVHGRNWGDSKGEDRYKDICVVLNPTSYGLFQRGRLSSMSGMTKHKLYVAITRARANVYFVEQAKLDDYLIAE